MNSPTLAIVLNWNDLDATRRCIRSLISQEDENCDLLLIDNYSEKDPTAIINAEFPDVHVLRNNKNIGVASARNIGIIYALENKYEFVLFIDNDAYADNRMLFKLMESAKSNPSSAIFGPKILYDDKKNIIWRAGCTSWRLTYLFSLPQVLRHIINCSGKTVPSFLDTKRGEGQVDKGQFDEDRDIDFQIGCVQLIRREVFETIGLLDEDYSPYGSEDIDFCARTKKANWGIRYVSGAICYHQAESSFRDEYERTYNNSKNIILLARKNLSHFSFWFCFYPDFIFLTIPLMFSLFLFKKKHQRRKALLDALLWNLNDVSKRGLLLRRELEKTL